MNDIDTSMRAPDGTEIVGALVTGRAVLKMVPSMGGSHRPEMLSAVLTSELMEPDADINLMRNTLALDLRAGAPCYVDKNGRAWMHKHLILPSQPPYSSEICAAMSIEAMIGRMQELALAASDVAHKLQTTGYESAQTKTWLRLAGKSLISAAEQSIKALEKIALEIAKEKSDAV